MAIGSLACPTNSETTMIYRIDPNSSSDITVPNVRHVIFIRTNPNSPLSLMTTITLANTFTKIIEFYRDENTSNNNWVVTLQTSGIVVGNRPYWNLQMTNTTNYSFKAYCNMTLEYTDTSGIILKPTINAVFRMNNNTLVNQTTA